MNRRGIYFSTDWSAVDSLLRQLKPSCVLWDFDGVLFHSSDMFFSILRKKLIDLKLLDHVYERVKSWESLLGANTHDLVEKLLGHKSDFDLHGFEIDLIETYKSAACRELSIDPIGLEIIKLNREGNVKQCVVSNGYPDLILQQLKKVDIDNAFICVVTPNEILKPKPSADMYLYVKSKFGFEGSECIVIDDSELGIAAAKSAGIRAIKFDLVKSVRCN